jgi:S-formylglutathione hydrolase FrmB
VYYLHGANSYALDPLYDFIFGILDELIGHPDPGQAIQPVVLVMPDGSAPPYAGSMWANSDLYGNYEDYVVNDVTQYAEDNYNITLERSRTGITGYSMGGMGSLSIAFAYPEMFCAVASNSGAPDFSLLPDEFFDLVRMENGGAAPYEYNPAAGLFSYLLFTAAGGYSPNLMNPPYYVDFPLDEQGEMRSEVYDLWYEHDPATRVLDTVPGELGIYFNCGTNDDLNFLPLNDGFAEVLTNYGYPFIYENDPGTHGGPYLADRIRASLRFLNGQFNGVVSVEDFEAPGESELNPVRTMQLAGVPNPFNPQTTIKYELGMDSAVNLGVFDVTGGLVNVLESGERKTAGPHSVIWNGLDRRGQAVPSGTYIVRLESDQGVESRKLSLIR